MRQLIVTLLVGVVGYHGDRRDQATNNPEGLVREQVETADIMPTLAELIDLPVDAAGIDGHRRDLDPGPSGSCAR